MQSYQEWKAKLKQESTSFSHLGSSPEFQSTTCDVNDYFINSAEDGTERSTALLPF